MDEYQTKWFFEHHRNQYVDKKAKRIFYNLKKTLDRFWKTEQDFSKEKYFRGFF